MVVSMVVKSKTTKKAFAFSSVAKQLGLDKATVQYKFHKLDFAELSMRLLPSTDFADDNGYLYDHYLYVGLAEAVRLFVARLNDPNWRGIQEMEFFNCRECGKIGQEIIFSVWSGRSSNNRMFICGNVRQNPGAKRILIANVVDWQK